MNLAFAGTPEFAAAALAALHAAGHRIVCVLTQPDRPAGRGLQLQPSAVKQLALAHGLPVLQPRSLRLDGKFPDDARAAQAALQAAAPDVMVVAAYGLILPQWVLALPRHGCINIHASLLPRWRGAAPIQRAIEAGDTQTGITLMQMDAGLDTGDMLLTAPVPIAPDDSAATLHDKLAPLGARLVVEGLAALARGALVHTPQPAEGVSYAHKIDKAEAPLDFTQPADVLARRIRAFDPFPGATARHGNDVIKLWRAKAAAGHGAPGTVLRADAQGVLVACGVGAIDVTELQRAGGKRLPAAAFLAGMPLAVGSSLHRP